MPSTRSEQGWKEAERSAGVRRVQPASDGGGGGGSTPPTEFPHVCLQGGGRDALTVLGTHELHFAQ